MKPPVFEYHRATSVDEAVALLTEHGDDAKVLAGGQSLVPLLGLRLTHPAHLIDINRLDELGVVANGDGLTVGGLVRHRRVERDATIAAANPLLAYAARFIGHRAIRNRGTIGGSLAHADPSAELPTVLAVLDGEVEVRSARGSRTIGAADLFEGFLTTSLAPDELLTAARFGAWPPGVGWSFHEFSRRSGDFAVVGVAVTVRLDTGGAVAEARLAFSGVAGQPLRATTVEADLVGATPSPDLWAGAARRAAAELDPPDDLHGSAAYRRHLAAALAERALGEAHDRAAQDAR